MAPNAFETIKAKFKALLKGKKSKKADKNADKTDAAAAPAPETDAAAPAAEGAAPEVNDAEPPKTADSSAPDAAEPSTAPGAEPAKTTETGEPPYIIGTLVKAQSTDTEIAAPEASKVDEPVKNESIVAATAPQL
ncbi:hypothetical protein NHQ30_005905 [Ciborinia camelliae]|nr:hypothetical protein NHQ30_005905 [Ciborinia camelliae]